MPSRLLLLHVALIVAACGAGRSDARRSPIDRDARATAHGERPRALPAQPSDIVLRNRTPQPVTLDFSMGGAAPVHVVDDAGALGAIELDIPPARCSCPCSLGRACTCTPEPSAHVELAPGASHRLHWTGSLLRLRSNAGWRCHDSLAPPSGRYLLEAWDSAGHAHGLATVELPMRAGSSLAIDLAPAPAASEHAVCPPAPALARGARIVLAHAALAGARPQDLSSCERAIARIRCTTDLPTTDPPIDLAQSECTIDVRADRGDVLAFTIAPAPNDGAPVSLSARISAAAIAAPSRVDLSASTWARSRDGRVRARGLDQHIRHTHGGDPARIGSARFAFLNETRAPVVIRARSIEWLESVDCGVPSSARLRPALREASIDHAASPLDALSLPPGRSEVSLYFEPQSAYQSWCNRFAARATFALGDAQLVTSAEWHVTRVTPLRAPP